MNNFKQLKVWQKAVELTTEIYKQTKSFPAQEQFGIISQITRSVVSIPSNIAEGAGRTTLKDFNHFLSIALGSSFETETLLIISNNLGYVYSFLSGLRTQSCLERVMPYRKHINISQTCFLSV